MHLQPVFRDYESVGGAVAAGLFERGLCLPSGSNLTSDDVARVAQAIRLVAAQSTGRQVTRRTKSHA